MCVRITWVHGHEGFELGCVPRYPLSIFELPELSTHQLLELFVFKGTLAAHADEFAWQTLRFDAPGRKGLLTKNAAPEATCAAYTIGYMPPAPVQTDA